MRSLTGIIAPLCELERPTHERREAHANRQPHARGSRVPERGGRAAALALTRRGPGVLQQERQAQGLCGQFLERVAPQPRAGIQNLDLEFPAHADVERRNAAVT